MVDLSALEGLVGVAHVTLAVLELALDDGDALIRLVARRRWAE